MTDVAVPIRAPEELVDRSAGDDRKAMLDLLHAAAADALAAVEGSGGGLYLAGPADSSTATSAFIETLREDVLDESDAPIIKVSSDPDASELDATYAALRDRSDAASVGILDPGVALLGRRQLDTAAMRLRREDVVVGPAPDGGWYFLGSSLSPDADVPSWDGPVDVLAERLAARDRSLGFVEMRPMVTRDADVPGIRRLLAARGREEGLAPFLTAWAEARPESER